MKEVSSKIRHWCARGERSPAQALRKLKGWGAGEQAEAEVAALEREGYVDAERFAQAFTTDHIRLKNWGPAKVTAALRQTHRIDDVFVRSAIEAMGEQEIQAAADRAASNWKRLHPAGEVDKGLMHLLRKGFSFDSAKRAIQAVGADYL